MEKELNKIDSNNSVPEKGKNSRMKSVLIEESINIIKKRNIKEGCPNKALNRNDICECLAQIMVDRYKENNLIYHSERMGMGTTLKMLREIDNYFYKHKIKK